MSLIDILSYAGEMCNSTDSEESDLVVLSALRASSAFLCAVINALVLASNCIRLDKSRPLHRLLIYTSLSSLLLLLANIAQAVSAFCFGPWFAPTCTFVGFANQFTSCLFLLATLWLVTVQILRYWCPNNRTVLTVRKEAAIWAGLVLLCALTATIPLGTEGYGINQAWCWLKGSRIAEQWFLWYGWAIALPGVTTAILAVALHHSEKRLEMYYESSRGINSTMQRRNTAAVKKMKAFLACKAVYWILVTIAITLYQVPQVRRAVPFLVTMAILEPFSIVIVPVVFTVLHDSESAHSAKLHSPVERISSEGATSINHGNHGNHGNGSMGKKTRAAKKQDCNRQDELRESLLITLEVSDEFDRTS